MTDLSASPHNFWLDDFCISSSCKLFQTSVKTVETLARVEKAPKYRQSPRDYYANTNKQFLTTSAPPNCGKAGEGERVFLTDTDGSVTAVK